VERGSPLIPSLGVPSRQATGAPPSSPLVGAPLSQSGDPEDFEGRCDGRGPSDTEGFSGSSPREYRRTK
jgi:hypothetical protein